MGVLATVDWTGFLEVGVPVWISAVGGAIAAIISALNRRALRTPSGDPIGEQVESTHHLTSANTALLTRLHKRGPDTEGLANPADILADPATVEET
jgi:hypothetical protein